jgi:NAD(P)-dependent dehydrogenase (short-subunit alcohol dehydrogenase family)
MPVLYPPRVAEHAPRGEGGPVDAAQDGMDGRTALVTGGSRGIGLAVARGLARAGATVVVVGRDASRVETAVAELVADGLDVTGRAVDVADTAAVRALPDALGPLAAVDVLVNAAGVMSERTAKTLRTSDEEWRRVLGTNLDGAFAVTATFVPGMVERRSGRVVNLSACLGRMSGPGTAGGLAPYRVSKAALNALTKNLSAELGDGRRGVLVDAVCPGHCRTDMGGDAAPRSAEQGADTVLWLARRAPGETGRLWEDRTPVPW